MGTRIDIAGGCKVWRPLGASREDSGERTSSANDHERGAVAARSSIAEYHFWLSRRGV